MTSSDLTPEKVLDYTPLVRAVDDASETRRLAVTLRSMTEREHRNRPTRPGYLSPTERLELLAAELDALPATPLHGMPNGLSADGLLKRCWPAAVSVTTVETVLVDEALRDAPVTMSSRHRETSRTGQQMLLAALAAAVGADSLNERREDALLLGEVHETSIDEAHMHLEWWLGSQGPGLQAALRLKEQLRGVLAAIGSDQATTDAVREAAAVAEIALNFVRVPGDSHGSSEQ